MYKAVSATTEVASSMTPHNTRVADGATLSVITSTTALHDLEQKWRKLEDRTINASNLFQSFDWVMAWTEIYITQRSEASLHVLAGYDGDELVFIWPLMQSRQMGVSVLTWLSDPFGQYGDVLCDKTQNARQWISSSVAFLKRLKDVDIVRLRHIRDDSCLLSNSQGLLVNARVPEKAPFLDFALYPDEAAYDARYSSVQRKRRKKIRKAIETIGPLTFERLPTGSVGDAAIKQAIDEKNAWLKERGRLNRVLGCPGHLEFLKNLSRRLGGTVDVVITEMKAGDQPVSWEVGFRHKHIHYGYITSHMNVLTDLSPGRLHMDLSQRACLNAGVAAYDLMVPNDAHKESWSTSAVNTDDYFLALSPIGHVIGHGYLRWFRPLLRNVYYKLEGSTPSQRNIRTMIASLFKRSKAPKHEQ